MSLLDVCVLVTTPTRSKSFQGKFSDLRSAARGFIEYLKLKPDYLGENANRATPLDVFSVITAFDYKDVACSGEPIEVDGSSFHYIFKIKMPDCFDGSYFYDDFEISGSALGAEKKFARLQFMLNTEMFFKSDYSGYYVDAADTRNPYALKLLSLNEAVTLVKMYIAELKTLKQQNSNDVSRENILMQTVFSLEAELAKELKAFDEKTTKELFDQIYINKKKIVE